MSQAVSLSSTVTNMERRGAAVFGAMVGQVLLAWPVDWLLGVLISPRHPFLMFAIEAPLSTVMGAALCVGLAGPEAKPAWLIYTAVVNSWFGVGLLTLIDRPHPLAALSILALNTAAARLGIVLGNRITWPRTPADRYGAQSSPTPIKKVIGGTIVAVTFLWLSYRYSSFCLALPAIWGYCSARTQVSFMAVRVLEKYRRRTAMVVDRFAFACVIGVAIRTSASLCYEKNYELIDEARLGSSERLEPALASRALQEADEFSAIRGSFAAALPLWEQERAFARLGRCADGGNSHCQVLFGMSLREAPHPIRDLERARHYTWLAFRDAHHPLALNNLVVYLHEAWPEPYSDALNKLQDPENADRVRSGCSR